MLLLLKNSCVLLFVYCLHLCVGATVCAQTLKGRITTGNGESAMAASLFVKEMKFGTSANDDGYYELKLPEGTYTCVFQSLGYETQTHTVNIGSMAVVLNISLRERAYEIKEVIISDKREDPAYGIMRRAIAMAPYYMNQVAEYKADLYLKGSLHIEKISRLVKRLAKEDLKDFKEGSTYVEESFNEIEFTAPNKYKQKVLKKTGSMPQGDSGGAMEQITTSVYDPKAIEPSISPLSSSAFAHYKFRYEGFIEEDNRVINKIKIIPKHKGKQLIAGYIYIADNYWNVHSLDVAGQFPIGGDYRVQVNFGEVNENVWLPVSHKIDFNGSILGNKGAFHYTSSLKYTHIAENTTIRKPDALLLAEQQRKAMQQNEAPPLDLETKTAAKSKTSEKIEKLLEKDDLNNRESYKLARLMQKEAETEKKKNEGLDLSKTFYEDYKVEVDSTANRKDTAYWEAMRPVPLMPDELKSYQEKAAKEVAQQPQLSAQKDTAKKEHKPKSKFVRTSGEILWGKNINLGKKGGRIEYRGLKPSRIGFNTVDGFFVGQKLPYYKDFGKKQRETRLTITPEVIWAINRKAVMWDVNANLTYLPLKRANATLAFGQKTIDFNGTRGMFPFENTVSSLFFRRNYMKLYEQSYVQANNTIDIINGLQVYAQVLYSKRTMLENSSDYSFFYQDSREYDPNVPENKELTYPLTNHTSTSFVLSVNYTPNFYYRVDRSNRKRMVKSDFPTFFAGWRKGLKNVLDSDSNYDLVYGGISQKIETGLWQSFKYQLSGGAFVNSKSIFFPDYMHFRTMEIPFTIGSLENISFNLLEYYRYSTSDKFAEAHLCFTTPFLALKYFPFFNNRLWNEGLQLNYLYTPEIKNYTELGYTIGLIWQAGIFVGFEGFNYRSVGFRLSLPLGMFIDEL